MQNTPDIPTRRTTIYDVAKAASVSHMTVSRVLKGYQGVRPDTVTRVKAAIKKLNYKPDPTLSALAAYRTKNGHTNASGNLAFLDRDGTRYSALVYEGLQEEADLQGYHIERHVLPRDPEKQLQLSRMLYSRGVRGLLFGPSFEEWHLPEWKWDEFAMVSLGAVSHQPQMHAVCMNYFEGALMACQILKERGCRRIGFAVNPFTEQRTGHRWLGGYSAAMGPKNLCIYEGPWPTTLEAFSKWCRKERLDGVLTATVSLSEGWPMEPKNFVMLNDINEPLLPGVMRIHLNPKQIGIEGIRFLHHLLIRREYGLPDKPKLTELQGTWALQEPKANA